MYVFVYYIFKEFVLIFYGIEVKKKETKKMYILAKEFQISRYKDIYTKFQLK